MLFLEIQIYSNIQIFLTQIFIRTFIRIRFFETNKFGYSFVQKHLYEYIRIFVRVKKNYANIFGYSFESKIWNEYIRIFVWVQILTNVTLCFKPFILEIEVHFKDGGDIRTLAAGLGFNVWNNKACVLRWPFAAAILSAVLPSLSSFSRSAPWSIKITQTSFMPREALI